jgi:hypothetical protein
MSRKRSKSQPSNILLEGESLTNPTKASRLGIVMLPLDVLKPHEKGSPLYLKMLRQEIVRDGFLRHPIIADRNTFVILDGMHRWLALKSLGYSLIPTILVDVFQNIEIRVGRRRIDRFKSRLDREISVRDVISAGLEERLMQPRSTRHFFPFGKSLYVNYQLEMLRKGPPRDVSQFVAHMTENECSVAIKEWLNELLEELAFLAERKEETETELKELQQRIQMQDQSPARNINSQTQPLTSA